MAVSLKRKKKTLAETAEGNLTITKKTSDGIKTLKQGVPCDHSRKHDPKSGAIVGMSKGVTKNMDNYESFRADVWLSDTVHDGETLEEAVARIEAFIDTTLEQAVLNSISDE